MGLLDDAIREHLELKRRSGADPGEIAHKEHEALAPVFPEEDLAATDDPLPPGGPEEVAEEADFAHVGQETAELDMSEVLDEQPQSSVAPAPARPISAGDESSLDTPQDSFEWEMSSGIGAAADSGPPPEIPGQERLTFE